MNGFPWTTRTGGDVMSDTLRIRSRLLSDSEAVAIREAMPFGPPWITYAQEIATDMGVNYITVCNIAAGLSYKRPKACPDGHPLRLQLNAVLAARQRLRSQVKPTVRKAMGEAQDWLCVYCGADISKRASIDHIVPVIRGGTSDPENLQLVCLRCNQSKGDLSHEEFLEKLKRIKVDIQRRDERARADGWDSWEDQQVFLACPCHHYGCDLDCPSCSMCGHPPGEPPLGQALCLVGEFGWKKCVAPDQCRKMRRCEEDLKGFGV